MPALSAMIFCLLGAAPASVYSAPATITGALDNRFSDNMAQSADNESSDTETRVTVGIFHETDPGKCSAQTGAELGYGRWWDRTYDPETYVDGNFFGLCELRAGLTWEVNDNLSQVKRDSRGTDTPDNRSVKNIFRTGPRYMIPLGARDQLNLSIQYQNTEFREPEETDSERYIGSAGWNHVFHPTLSGGVSVSTNRADLDTGGEIDTNVVSLNWIKNWAATDFTGSLGYSKLTSRFGTFEQSSDGLVGQVSIERDVSGSLRLYLNASQELTDQTSDFDVRFEDFTFNLRETTEVRVTTLNFGGEKEFSSGAIMRISFFANRADYLRVDDKEDTAGVDVTYSRPISPLWSFDAAGRYEYAYFNSNGQNDETFSLSTGLSYSMTQDFQLTGSVGHNQRQSDAASSEYKENWVILGLNYQFR